MITTVRKYIGIDPAIIGRHVATIVSSTGEKEKTLSFLPSKKDIEFLISVAKGSESAQLNFVMEPTSTAWMPIAFYLASQGHVVFMIKPEKIADLRKFYKKHTKSDRIDSLTLAKLPLVDKESLYPYILPDDDYFSLARLCKQRAKLTKSASGTQCRIRTIVDILIPTLQRNFNDLFSAMGRKFLRCYADPHKVKSAGLLRFTKVMKKAAKGHIDPQKVKLIYASCIDAVDFYSPVANSGKLPFSFSQLQAEINRELDHLQFIENQISQLDKEIEPLYLKLDPNQLLKDFKGIGPINAPVLLSLLGGDMSRFHSARKFVGFLGFRPRKKQTSQTDRKGTKITKASNWLLKQTLYMIADTARQWDPQCALKYNTLLKKGKHHNQAICAVAMMIARRVYSVLKRVQAQQKLNQINEQTVKPLRYELRDFEGKKVDSRQAKELIKRNFSKPDKNSSKDKKRGEEKNLNRGSAEHSTKDFSIHPLSDVLDRIKDNILNPNKVILSDLRCVFKLSFKRSIYVNKKFIIFY